MNNTKILKLETDYTKNGNSTDEQVNTLSIALGYGDINDIEENSFDWLDNAESYALNEWLNDESNFQKELSKIAAKKYSEDLDLYNIALTNWCNAIREQVWSYDDEHPARIEMQKARDSAYDDMRHEWLYGDRSSHGVIGEAKKHYCDGDMDIDYDKKNNTVSVSFSDDDIATCYEEGRIAEKTAEEFVYWLECLINNDAYSRHQKETSERAKRRAEWEKTREYKKEQKKKEDEAKREKLRKLSL